MVEGEVKVEVFWENENRSGSFVDSSYVTGCSWDTVEFMYLEGNYSCDCNLAHFAGLKSYEKSTCGDKMKVTKLVQLDGDGLWEA